MASTYVGRRFVVQTASGPRTLIATHDLGATCVMVSPEQFRPEMVNAPIPQFAIAFNKYHMEPEGSPNR
jgi:hypothetical protein